MSISRSAIQSLLQPKKVKEKKPHLTSAANNMPKTQKELSGSYTRKGGIATNPMFKALGARSSETKEGIAHKVTSNKMVPGPDGDVKNARLIMKRGGTQSPFYKEPVQVGPSHKSLKTGGKCAKEGMWIQGAIKHPGALHKSLHVPQGQKIPAMKLEKAEHSRNPLLRKRANLAATLKGFKKGK